MLTTSARAGQENFARTLVVLVPLLWAVNYVVARKAPGVIEPHTLALGRWGLAGLLLAAFSWRELWRERRALRAAWPQYLVLGTLGMLICGAWVYIAGHSTGAMNIALIYSASPVMIMIASALWLHERMTRLQTLGVGLAFSGVLHVIVKGQWTLLGQLSFSAGDLWIVAASISWALYAILMKTWPSTLTASARLAATCAGGVVALLPFAAWECLSASNPGWSIQAVGLTVTAALLPGIGAYWAYSHAQQVLGDSRVAVSLYLGPLCGAVVAWGLLGEQLQMFHLMGALLILPGIVLATQRA
jgi:drug/metabolite transporter (DMT)-like permease